MSSPDELVAFLTQVVRDEALYRFEDMKELEAHSSESVQAARRYASAMLGLQVWSHKLYGCVKASAHGSAPHEHAEG